jgi:hypothetical protein
MHIDCDVLLRRMLPSIRGIAGNEGVLVIVILKMFEFC